jgi:glycosyltransferase involved in cell wall biosynthesis
MLRTGAGVVSIIIPTFNDGRWVCDAVDSALAQTYPSCEIIVVDDGSTDETQTLISDRYGQSVRYFYQPNRGLAAARNTGLSVATGEYVQFLDADDVLLPAKVATHVAALESHHEYSVVYSDFAFMDDTLTGASEPGSFQDRYRSGQILSHLLADSFIVAHAALSRLEDIRSAGGFDETLAACEDYDLWLRLAAAGRLFLHTPDVLVLYRRRSGSMSTDTLQQIASTIEVIAKVPTYTTMGRRDRHSHRRRLADLREMMVRSLALEGLASLKRNRFRHAAARLLRAVAYHPGGIPRICLGIAVRSIERLRNRRLTRAVL